MDRKNLRSMKGSGCCDSWSRNPANAHAAAVAIATTHGCVQPRPGLSIRTKTKPKRLPAASACPTGSKPRIVADLLSGTNSAHAAMATAATGRLIQNTERQPNRSMSTPPTTGPSATEAPNTEPQMPIARALSAGPMNTWAMIPSATGFIIEAPTACNARAAISASMTGARLHSREPSMKIAKPV